MNVGEGTVEVCDLTVHARIGATPAERAYAQRLLISFAIELEPGPFTAVRLDETVDYSAASRLVQELLLSREWELLEHAAAAISETILAHFASARAIRATIKKYALPQAAWAGFSLRATRA